MCFSDEWDDAEARPTSKPNIETTKVIEDNEKSDPMETATTTTTTSTATESIKSGHDPSATGECMMEIELEQPSVKLSESDENMKDEEEVNPIQEEKSQI